MKILGNSFPIFQPASANGKINRYGTTAIVTPNFGLGTKSNTSIVSGKNGLAYSFTGATSQASYVNLGTNFGTDTFYQSPGWLLVLLNPGLSSNWNSGDNFICAKSDANNDAGWILYRSEERRVGKECRSRW